MKRYKLTMDIPPSVDGDLQIPWAQMQRASEKAGFALSTLMLLCRAASQGNVGPFSIDEVCALAPWEPPLDPAEVEANLQALADAGAVEITFLN